MGSNTNGIFKYTKRQSIPTEKPLYAFDLSKLQAGDIILTRTPNSPESFAIRMATGRFSHALIVVKPPYCVESSNYGVVKFNALRFGVASSSNVLLLRLLPEHSQKLPSALAFIERQIAKEYNTAGAFRSIIPGLPKVCEDRFFCSELVASAFYEAELPLFPDIAPHNVTPSMLKDCALFYPVTDALLRCSDVTRTNITTLLDRSGGGVSPNELQTAVMQGIVRRIAPDFARLGYSVASYPEAILTVRNVIAEQERDNARKLDQEFAAAILSSRLIPLVHDMSSPEQNCFFQDLYVFNALRLGTCSSAVAEELLECMSDELAIHKATVVSRDLHFRRVLSDCYATGSETLRLECSCIRSIKIAQELIVASLEKAIEYLRRALGSEFFTVRTDTADYMFTPLSD
jgi:hypothetical protein